MTSPLPSPIRSADDPAARKMGVSLVVMGVLHFVAPGPFEKIVPRALSRPRTWVYVSGVAELVAGVMTLVPRTRRAGALLGLGTMLAVWPANWQMALDAGFPPRTPKAVGIWLRLPMQLPMLRQAWQVAERARSQA